MSSNKCARCEQTVYPVEGLRCLDKIWHKGCFKCHECNMTLNMKNYKGFEKRPYCNAHCPQAKATTVADTPESRRLAENTRIQSQAKYHEDFEKSKGKGFTTIADDPETRRIKETSKIISNVAYHGELERKKQMEERRGISGPDSVPLAKINSNSMFNNNDKDQQYIDKNQQQQHIKRQNNHHSLIMNNNNPSQDYDTDIAVQNHRPDDVYPNSQNLQDHQRQVQRQQQQLISKQQQQQIQLLKQQQAYAQDQFDAQQQQHIGHPQNVNDFVHPQHMGQKQQQTQQQKQYSMSPQQQQQQLLMRQQQQQQLLMQQQFQRQSLDPMMPIINRQAPKQQTNNPQHQQQIIKNNQHQQGVPQQQQQPQPTKYVAMNEVMPNQALPPHLIAGAGPPAASIATHFIPNSSNNHQLAGPMHQNQRLIPNHPAMIGPNQQHQMIHVYNNQMGQVNGVPKQQQQFVAFPNQQHRQMLLHPSQMQPMAHHQQQQQHPQMRPPIAVHQRVVQQQPPPPSFTQQPPRIYRAMYDYVANDVDEVSFFENDVLVDCVNVDRNWLIGKVARSGQTGMLPANYVTELPSQ